MFGHDLATFKVAEQYCLQHGGHLIHVDNSHENDFIKDRLRDLKPSHFWNGLTDEFIEGTWIYVDTQTNATFLDFYKGYGHQNTMDCAMFAYNLTIPGSIMPVVQLAKPVCERSRENCSCDESTAAAVLVG